MERMASLFQQQDAQPSPGVDPWEPTPEMPLFGGNGGGDASALLPWIDGPEHDGASPLFSAPTMVADSGPPIPKGARYDPRFTALAHGPIDEKWAPNTVRLPDAVDAGLDEAWRQTAADSRHREHGGNIVRTYGGKYEMNQQGPGLEGAYDDDDSDVGWTEDHVAVVHTHPYFNRDFDHAGFSGGDFVNLATNNVPLSIMRSGSDQTYMLARTKQFQKMVDDIENKYDHDYDLLHEKRQEFEKGMDDHWEAAYAAALKKNPKDFPGAVEAAGVATAKAYHLLYYKGTGANLKRIGGGPPMNK
jgi:hypothetical protein